MVTNPRDLLEEIVNDLLADKSELHRLARTLDRWRTEIETSIITGTHNGRTEAANAKIKDVKRSARGFRNFANYRLRILLAAGSTPRETQPVTKIRTRRPSFVA